ncbi:MAG: AMP-binding protein [Deltaproteobacteria bacterium]|nr:AMP-binding protein [Deltaproteobacteria bacterium]
MNWLELDDPKQRTLGAALRRQAKEIPDTPFILAGDTRYSYAAVDALANAWASGLREAGVGQGDTVAIFMESCPEFVFAAFGANKLGAIWVPTNTDYKGEWLRAGFEDSRARVLLTDAKLLPRIAELGDGLAFERIYVRGEAAEGLELCAPLLPLAELVHEGAEEPGGVEVVYGDTAAVLWTSGTTGRAKGVMQSHNAWIRAAQSGARSTGVQEGDILYSCLPMYNSAAWVTNIYRALVCGIPFGLDSHFSAQAFWDRCRHYGATMTFTLGAMHIFLWQAPRRDDDADNPIREASMIPMPAELVGPFRERFGIDRIDQGYGQSEVMGIFARADDGTRSWKPNSLGEVVKGIELTLLDDEDLPVATGEVGEFCVRPSEPHVIFNGYFNNSEATLRSFSNLWYHTGDLGRCDEDGEYFFVDRKADFIRFKGRNVSSFAVEASVAAHPAVAQAAAHGVVSEQLEHEAEIKICVVLEPGAKLTPEELARFVNDNAPYFFVPRYIEFVDSLPQTPTGRVQKFKLRERGVTSETWDGRVAGFALRR